MMTREELAALARRTSGVPVLSAYLAPSASDPAAREAWRVTLDGALAGMRDRLTSAGTAERAAFARAAATLRAWLHAEPHAARAPGWAAFFPAEGEPRVDALPVAPETLLDWRPGARLAPYVGLLARRPTAVVAVADSRHARAWRLEDDGLRPIDEWRAHAPAADASHLGHPPRPGFHPGTRGLTGTDAAQRALRAARRSMLATLGAELAVHAGEHAPILVGGIPEVAAEAIRALPEGARWRARRLASLDVHAGEPVIRAVAAREAATARQAHGLDVVLDVLDRVAAGAHGAVGAPAVLEALHEHAAHRVCLTATFVHRCADEAEAVVAHALAAGVGLELVAGAAAVRLDAAGGVGALLRRRLLREQRSLESPAPAGAIPSGAGDPSWRIP